MATDTKVNDGGAAFPTMERDEVWSDREGRYLEKLYPAGGMTLRDFFAAKAMQALIAATVADPKIAALLLERGRTEGLSAVDYVAQSAGEFADAMLRARQGK